MQAKIQHLLCNRHLLDSVDLELLYLSWFSGRVTVLDRGALKGKEEHFTLSGYRTKAQLMDCVIYFTIHARLILARNQ